MAMIEHPTLDMERQLAAQGCDVVIGCDEVGRGALAGPVKGTDMPNEMLVSVTPVSAIAAWKAVMPIRQADRTRRIAFMVFSLLMPQ